jgi:hypothetical protein
MILAGLFLTLVVYFTYRFLLSNNRTQARLVKLTPAFIFFGALFVLVALFSLSDWITTLAPRNLSPISTITEWDASDEGQVLLVGNLTFEMGAVESHPAPHIRLTDGEIPFSLQKNRLILASRTSESVVMIGDKEADGLVVGIVYGGTLQGYYTFLDRYAVIPAMTVFLMILGALVTWAIPIYHWWRLNKIKPSATES